jgi:o-succinylbenzoate synthase
VTLTLRVARVQRTLPASVENAHQRWHTRAALQIHVADGSGTHGLGECSPLPGYSPDTLAACELALAELELAPVPERCAPDELEPALREASRALPRELPAARCALETALLDLWSRQLARPAWQLLRPASVPPAPRRLAALLASLDSATEDAAEALARGITAFKLKLGRPGALAAELAAARALKSALPAAAKLRLDANQALSVHARAALREHATLGPEWLEEPCAPDELAQLGDLDLPVALDESLSGRSPAELDQLCERVPGVCAVVLKPMLLGVLGCLELAERAQARGLAVVLSHTFDDAPALAVSAALALAVGSTERAHGLDLRGARFVEKLPGFRPGSLEPWTEPGLGLAAEPA